MQLLYDHLEISRRVKNLGREISSAYKGCDLVVAGILKGGFIFMADLVRQIDLPMEIDFARLSSYQNADTPQGAVKIIQDITTNISGRHVLLVDDILDTGQSLKAYRQHLETRHPAS
ncbi:MAG: phosphoribosyltransferase family protein, partial [Thermodesulfobacteriota bacterium]|nr:phosphoribosyltransferase family protein [Thermodesulfobacteriota bacterium]